MRAGKRALRRRISQVRLRLGSAKKNFFLIFFLHFSRLALTLSPETN